MLNEANDASGYRGNRHRNAHEVAEWHARSSPGVALEATLPIVDPHHHLYGRGSDEGRIPQKVAGAHLLGFAAPVDVAYALLYLGSDESRSTTAHVVTVDGGYTSGRATT